jgi:glucokinase
MNSNQNSNTSTINLVADIGGTNIRLAIATAGSTDNISEIETYQCKNFDSLQDVIKTYIETKKIEKNKIHACLAIACPVDNDLISMTNLPWEFSQKALKQQLKLDTLTLINDYTAIAMAIPLLSENQKVKIGGGSSTANKPISVCGPGTGLGVANLVPVENKWHCFSGEGGHIDFAATNELEQKVFSEIKAIKQRVSYEQLLSGYGLEQIYQALVNINTHDTDTERLSAKDISNNALNKRCKICEQSLTLFCNILGDFSGNLALLMNSQGGVYIAGGIVPRFIDYLKATDFRSRFESKGRLSHITQKTPTYVITEEQPGLLGAAAFILQNE